MAYHTESAPDQYPRLKVRGPEGPRSAVELRRDRITIGRLADCNDIALEPDPENLVSRQAHCLLERRDRAWFVVDNQSRNGTFLLRGSSMEPVRSATLLAEGDVIRIHARRGAAPQFWELLFEDPSRTGPVVEAPATTHVEFNRARRALFVVTANGRNQVDARRQERELLAYMAERNAENPGEPVLCTHEELIQAVWGREPDHRPGDITHLVSRLRAKVRKLAGEDVPFVETVRGTGYSLLIPSEPPNTSHSD
jgi:DNA-binding winged helix-turn-helix (wHTH) protein